MSLIEGPSHESIIALLQNKVYSQDFRFIDEAMQLKFKRDLWVEVFKVGLNDQKLLNYLDSINWDMNAQEATGEVKHT